MRGPDLEMAVTSEPVSTRQLAGQPFRATVTTGYHLKITLERLWNRLGSFSITVPGNMSQLDTTNISSQCQGLPKVGCH